MKITAEYRDEDRSIVCLGIIVRTSRVQATASRQQQLQRRRAAGITVGRAAFP